MPDLLERLTAAVAERYRIERELGRGGMATVFLARDLKHSRWVAIKVLDPEVAAAIGPERFLREIGTIASLTHPQILPLYDSGQVDGLLFYVMPYIEGESLRDRLTREKQLPLEDALRITRELADALGYAHGCGVVHRDVKPENILFEQGHAVLADFGIARTESVAGREKLTATGIMVGTPTYMSPEQVAGSRDVEGRSDLYALGCVLYEMLAGQPPFTGPTAESLAYQHVSVSPRAVTELRPGVPAGVAAALQRALAKTPADRYATLAEFVRALGAPSPVQRRRGVRQWLAAGAAVLVAYLAIAIWQHLPPFAPSPRAQPITSVAVLPFANLSGDESQEYYADGMTEALINELGKIGNLKVISRTSVMRFKHTEKSLPEIARTLNVDAVVEASVLRDANNVRVTAQLVRADPEQQLWAESYTRDAADVLVLHSQLARAIADRIRVTVTPVEREQLTRTRRVDPAAYEDYLIGRSLVDKWTRDEVERGIGYLQQALERDPNYAPAYAGLATAYMYSTAPGGGWRSPVEVIDKARAAAERALEMDESLAEAHVALAEVSGLFDWDFGRALRETDRAIELDPGLADARIVKGAVLRRLGGRARYEEALEQLETALRTDPLNPWARGHLMATYAELGDSAKVYEESQKLIDMTPEPLWKAMGFVNRSIIALQAGRTEEALAGFEQALGLSGRKHPDLLTYLGVAYGMAGRHEDAVGILNEMTALAKTRYVSPVLFAQLHASLGHIDAAFEALERAYALRCSYLYDITSLKAQLGADPRWDKLVKRIGLPDKEQLVQDHMPERRDERDPGQRSGFTAWEWAQFERECRPWLFRGGECSSSLVSRRAPSAPGQHDVAARASARSANHRERPSGAGSCTHIRGALSA